MSSTYKDWQDYQEAVASVFKELGCTVRVEAKIEGARATHKIDVYVTFLQHGIPCRWVIECKLWKGHVKKKDVLTLRGVVEDIGANRGIMFSENGFQPSAHEAAHHTNILLLKSLEEFKRTISLDKNSTALIYQESDQLGAPPIYMFPNGDQPQHILEHRGLVFVGNWQTGNISVVNPATKSIEKVIQLDKYEVSSNSQNGRTIKQYPPGKIACADGKLFVGQVFSEFVLVIDIDTLSIVKRIMVHGGAEGAIAASPDGKYIYFASNKVNRLFIIDSATYEYREVDYPNGGRGCMCILPHPSKPLLYIGIQRAINYDNRFDTSARCFLATYNLAEHGYTASLCLAEIENGQNDCSIPHWLTYDEEQRELFVGMFQSRRGICRVDENGNQILQNIRFAPNAHNRDFSWVDPLSQAIYGDKLFSVNRNNCELVILDKFSGRTKRTVFLGEAPKGPQEVMVINKVAIINYPERQGLIFLDLHANHNA